MEASIFSDFRHKVPNFAGSSINPESIARGPKDENGNPCPDFVCSTDDGKKIGLELTEWLHEDQMKKAQEKLRDEERFLSLLGTEREDKPSNIGFIQLDFKDVRFPTSKKQQEAFRQAFYTMVEHEDHKITIGTEEFNPGGFYWTNDFSLFSILSESLFSMTVWERNFQSLYGPRWVGSSEKAGAYTPRDSFEALKKNIQNKIQKSTYPALIRMGTISEIYLLVYYDQARYNNTPYHGNMESEGRQERVSFIDIAKMTADWISGASTGPFASIFLFNHIEFRHENPQDHIFQLYPSFEPCIPR